MTPEQKRQAQRREFLRSHGFPLAAGTVAVGGLVVAITIFLMDDRQPPIRKAPDLTVVTLVEPPPPPPPPEVVEPEMVEQPEVVEPEIEQEEITEEPPEPSDEPPPEVASDEPPLGPLGLDAVAEALAHERLALKPHSPVNRGFLARARAYHTANELPV